MKKTAFYSVIRNGELTGIMMQYGFEIEIDGEKFNAYRRVQDDRAFIIDQTTGIAVHIYNYGYDEIGVLLTDIEIIEKAKEKLIENKECLTKWREWKNRESYKLAVQTFEAYKRAEELREKQKEAARRERDAGQQ